MKKLLIVLLFPLTAFGANTLTWDASPGATGYSVERKGVPCGTDGTWAEISIPTATTYVDAALADDYLACYRVAATNATEKSGYSNEAGKALAAPVGLQVQ